MGKRITKILKGQVTSSVFYIILGLCLIIAPVQAVDIICKMVFGLLLIGTGCYHVYIYIREKENATILDLFSGVIILVLGGFLFWNRQIVVKLLPRLLGAFVLVDSIWTLQSCLKLKKRGREEWKILLGGGALFIVLAIVMIINPFAKIRTTAVFSGWIFFCNGLADVAFLILLRKVLKEIETGASAVAGTGDVPASGGEPATGAAAADTAGTFSPWEQDNEAAPGEKKTGFSLQKPKRLLFGLAARRAKEGQETGESWAAAADSPADDAEMGNISQTVGNLSGTAENPLETTKNPPQAAGDISGMPDNTSGIAENISGMPDNTSGTAGNAAGMSENPPQMIDETSGTADKEPESAGIASEIVRRAQENVAETDQPELEPAGSSFFAAGDMQPDFGKVEIPPAESLLEDEPLEEWKD